MSLRILIACECSGTVRDAFRALGVDAWSCDTKPDVHASPFHIIGDVRDNLTGLLCLRLSAQYRKPWHAMIAHPPCTFLNAAGLHWITRGRIEADGRPRAAHQAEALQFVRDLWAAPIEHVALENPQGCINTKLPWMPRPQYVQPYYFGDDASKKTGLWRRGLPELTIDPAQHVQPRAVCRSCGHCTRAEIALGAFSLGCAHCGADAAEIAPRWSNQTNSGQNKLAPSPERGALRSVTYPGIATAMAAQWVAYLSAL